MSSGTSIVMEHFGKTSKPKMLMMCMYRTDIYISFPTLSLSAFQDVKMDEPTSSLVIQHELRVLTWEVL